MTATSSALKQIFDAGRPLIQQWLEIADQISALRDVATEKGLDWSQVKALLKAQVQDDIDGTGEGKRVKRIVERAEYASAYADMLGLANMNENNFSAGTFPVSSAESGRGVHAATSAPAAPIPEPEIQPLPVPEMVAVEVEGERPVAPPSTELPDMDFPAFLDRRPGTEVRA